MVSGSNVQAYRFIVPVLVLEVLFVGIPLLIGFYVSFYRADYFNITSFRGLDNYIEVITSPIVFESLIATLVFSVCALIFTFVAGFSLAILFERDNRANIVGRVIVLIPYTISMLVGSLLLKWIFSPDAGVMQLALSPFGLIDPGLLSNPRSAMAALVFNAVWRDSAFAMILLMAGLKSIPPQLYAAARIDGAGPLYRFVRITLPMMRIPIAITLVRLLIHFVNVLTFSLVLTAGGPNNATLTMGLAMYRIGLVDFRIGQANALAILVMLFNVILISALLALFQRRGRL